MLSFNFQKRRKKWIYVVLDMLPSLLLLLSAMTLRARKQVENCPSRYSEKAVEGTDTREAVAEGGATGGRKNGCKCENSAAGKMGINGTIIIVVLIVLNFLLGAICGRLKECNGRADGYKRKRRT